MGCAILETTGHDGQPFAARICGGAAIKACVACGRLSTRLCDFKLGIKRGVSKSGHPWQRVETCSAPICAKHTTRLPGDKDACPEHRQACLDACARRGLAVPA